MEDREFLTKEQILEGYDKRLSWRAAEAIKFMDDTPISPRSDIGRLMQIQSFRADWLLPGKKETQSLETWRTHYKACGCPFLVVTGLCNRLYIYKYRVIVDEENKKRAYYAKKARLEAEKA